MDRAQTSKKKERIEMMLYPKSKLTFEMKENYLRNC